MKNLLLVIYTITTLSVYNATCRVISRHGGGITLKSLAIKNGDRKSYRREILN